MAPFLTFIEIKLYNLPMDARTIEEPLFSETKMDEFKQREFREYLVK